jgi:cyanophycinase
VGGAEWTEGCSFDAALVAGAGAGTVTVLPTASAYERPELVVARATEWFAALGVAIDAVPVLIRADAVDPGFVERVRRSTFLYFSGGSAMHLLSVLKRTALWDAVRAAHQRGATVAAAGSSADVLCDAMVDSRGGGFGVGLGLVTGLSLIPRYNQWSAEKVKRTIQLAPAGLLLAGIPERTALIRDLDGVWRAEGAGEIKLFRDHQPQDLAVLASLGAGAA